GHVVGDHRQLAFQIDAPGLVGQADRGLWRDKGIGATLVHQRVVPEGFRHLRTAGLAHQLHVIDVGTAAGPVVGARQRAVTGGLVEGKGAPLQPVVETLIDRLELGLAVAPVVQRVLQRGSDLRHLDGVGKIARDHDQHAVAALIEGCEFHQDSLPGARQELTYSGTSTAAAASPTSRARRVSIITATSSAKDAGSVLAFFKAFGCGTWGKPQGWKVTMPCSMLSRLKKLPRW